MTSTGPYSGSRSALLLIAVGFAVSSSARADEPDERAMRAVISVRAEEALTVARQHYAASAFEECEVELLRAERELRSVLAGPEELQLAKRINQWLGLCQSVAGTAEAARRSFALSDLLPGPAPDSSVFPPQVIRMHRAATRPRSRCRLELPTGQPSAWIDGRIIETGAEVELGEHYVARESGQPAERIEITKDCRISLPPSLRVRHRITDAEATSPIFLTRVARRAGLRTVRVAKDDAVIVFDADAQTFTASSAPALPPTAPIAADPPPEKHSEPSYWWAWVLAGAAVASAIAIPTVILTRNDESDEPRYRIGF